MDELRNVWSDSIFSSSILTWLHESLDGSEAGGHGQRSVAGGITASLLSVLGEEILGPARAL